MPTHTNDSRRSGTLNVHLIALRKKSAEERERARKQLKRYVEQSARELSSDQFVRFENATYQQVFAAVNAQGAELADRVAAVQALDALVDCFSVHPETKAIKFANALSNCLRTATHALIVTQVGSALGHMLESRLIPSGDFVEFEVVRGLEWLSAPQSHRRLAACLVLDQFAHHTAPLFYAKASHQLFERLLPVLGDQSQDIREAAAALLATALAILAKRQSPNHLQEYCELYAQVQSGLGDSRVSEPVLHGALLTARVLLAEAEGFMGPRFHEVCEGVLARRDHKSRLIRETVLKLIPKLAHFSPDAFAHLYLNTSLEHFLKVAKKHEELRSQVFLSIGELATDVKHHLHPYLDQVVNLVQEALRNKKKAPFCIEALACISCLVKSLGAHKMGNHISQLLDPMFAVGLTEHLVTTLAQIIQVMTFVEVGSGRPRRLNCSLDTAERRLDTRYLTGALNIRCRVLEELAIILQGKHYLAPGRLKPPRARGTRLQKGDTSIIEGYSQNKPLQYCFSPSIRKGSFQARNESQLCLALKTLGSFDFSHICLLPFVQGCLVHYLYHTSQLVREEAAITCCHLLIPSMLKGPSAKTVEVILERLLQVALSDPVPSVRRKILCALEPRFDTHLAQAHHLHSLFLLLCDEDLYVRLDAFDLLGRLADLNPAYVLPPLRETLRQVLLELRLSESTAAKEDATRMLCAMFKPPRLRKLIIPLTRAIIEVLPFKQNSRLATAALEALGALALVVGEALLPYLGALMPALIENMQDQSSVLKREVSLRTLSQIVRSTGYVIRPYLQYPLLMPKVLSVLRGGGNPPWMLKRECFRALGLLGALDPNKVKLIENHLRGLIQRHNQGTTSLLLHSGFINPAAQSGDVKTVTVNLEEEDIGNQPAHSFLWEQSSPPAMPVSKAGEKENKDPHLTPFSPNFYPRLTITALRRMLRDPSLSTHHPMAIEGIMFHFKSLGVLRAVPFLEETVPDFLEVFPDSSFSIQELILQQLAALAEIVGVHLRAHLPAICDLLERCWEAHMIQGLELVQDLAKSVREEFLAYLPRVVPLLLGSLRLPREQAPPKGAERLRCALQCMQEARPLLGTYLHLLIPGLLGLLEKFAAASPEERDAAFLTLQTKAFETLESACMGGALAHGTPMVSRILQVVLRILDHDHHREPAMVNAVEKLACTLAQELGPQFLIFEPLLTRSFTKHRIHAPTYMAVKERLNSGQIWGQLNPSTSSISLPTMPQRREEDVFVTQTSFAEHLLVPQTMTSRAGVQGTHTAATATPGGVQGLHVNQNTLQRSWDIHQCSTRDDWQEWLRRFSVDLLRESPSPSLRSCAALAQAYPPLARELFYAAFVSCWLELSENAQESLIRALESAFQSDTISPEILQLLLNLAEFMEHDVESLPIDIRLLADLAKKCNAYAKALHYKEFEFATAPEACVEDLIAINNKVGQPEAALGTLHYAQKQFGHEFAIKERWLVMLDNHKDALELYQKRMQGDPNDNEAIVGSMKCLHAFGKWKQVLNLVQSHWGKFFDDPLPSEYGSSDSKSSLSQQMSDSCFPASSDLNASLFLRRQDSTLSTVEDGIVTSFPTSLTPNNPSSHEASRRNTIDTGSAPGSASVSRRGSLMSMVGSSAAANTVVIEQQQDVASLAARACWNLGQWGPMEGYMGFLDQNDVEAQFLRSILSLHQNRFGECALWVDRARRNLDNTFTALLSESYKRAYDPLIFTQQLSEIEEIMDFKQLSLQGSSPLEIDAAKRHLVRKWGRRLRGCQAEVIVWQQILSVRSLVLSPAEDLDTQLSYAALCLHNGNYSLTEQILSKPLAVHPSKLFDADNDLASVSGSHSFHRPASVSSMSMYPPARLQRSNSSPISDPNSYSPMSSSGLQIPGSAGPPALRSVVSTPSMFGAGSPCVTPFRQSGTMCTTYSEGRLAYSFLKYLWATGQKDIAIARMKSLANALNSPTEVALKAKCMLRRGQWKLAKIPPGVCLRRNVQEIVLNCFQVATQLQPDSFKAWKEWAMTNCLIVEHFTDPGSVSGYRSSIPWGQHRRMLQPNLEAAAKGLLRAISLGKMKYSASVQQLMLALLTIWFRHGHHLEVYRVLEEGLGTINLDNWLGVLPQMIARVHIKHLRIQRLLHDLIKRIGARHPQALVYPLSVVIRSPRPGRKEAALELMQSLKSQNASLVDQSLLVSSELIRVAILWHEQWHSGLEEASRQYFGDGDVRGMLATLLPLHRQLDAGAKTMSEHAFRQAYGRELEEAHNCLKRYKLLLQEAGLPVPLTAYPSDHPPNRPRGRGVAGSTQDQGSNSGHLSRHRQALDQAWELYYNVFSRINKELPGMTTLELQGVSPALLEAKDLELAVPGTYRVDQSLVRIRSVGSTIQVIPSKQRPRKITMHGEDGKNYVFLLKGHEDLRQDERVMQLKGQVNALLRKDRRTNKHDLTIQRYTVLPLSCNAGIVGWVPNCETLHTLIRDYRDSRKILLNIEHRLMMQMAPDYESLTLLQKVEVFESALEHTAGMDLYRVLWLKSRNSEAWLDRRTNYTRSLAVMSMVGYILGLGDRHPSNLMLDKFSGKILHIDFGDCFEVAMHRDKFPEKIPFRLTRMLANAMGVSGIEGNFRSTCENVMTVLRDNSASLVTMLEAFVHDPLISWRLHTTGENPSNSARGAAPSQQQRAPPAPQTNSHSAGPMPVGSTDMNAETGSSNSQGRAQMIARPMPQRSVPEFQESQPLRQSLRMASIPEFSAVGEGGDQPSSQNSYEQENAESELEKAKAKAALTANSPTETNLKAEEMKDTDSNNEEASVAPKNEENLQTGSPGNKDQGTEGSNKVYSKEVEASSNNDKIDHKPTACVPPARKISSLSGTTGDEDEWFEACDNLSDDSVSKHLKVVSKEQNTEVLHDPMESVEKEKAVNQMEPEELMMEDSATEDLTRVGSMPSLPSKGEGITMAERSLSLGQNGSCSPSQADQKRKHPPKSCEMDQPPKQCVRLEHVGEAFSQVAKDKPQEMELEKSLKQCIQMGNDSNHHPLKVDNEKLPTNGHKSDLDKESPGPKTTFKDLHVNTRIPTTRSSVPNRKYTSPMSFGIESPLGPEGSSFDSLMTPLKPSLSPKFERKSLRDSVTPDLSTKPIKPEALRPNTMKPGASSGGSSGVSDSSKAQGKRRRRTPTSPPTTGDLQGITLGGGGTHKAFQHLHRQHSLDSSEDSSSSVGSLPRKGQGLTAILAGSRCSEMDTSVEGSDSEGGYNMGAKNPNSPSKKPPPSSEKIPAQDQVGAGQPKPNPMYLVQPRPPPEPPTPSSVGRDQDRMPPPPNMASTPLAAADTKEDLPYTLETKGTGMKSSGGDSETDNCPSANLHLQIARLAEENLERGSARLSVSAGGAGSYVPRSHRDRESTRREEEGPQEALNVKAVKVIKRVRDKLTGLDFSNTEALDVSQQVDNLIQQATSNENLCQCFIGWCPFW